MKTYHLGGLVLAGGLILASVECGDSASSSGGGGYTTAMSPSQSASTTVRRRRRASSAGSSSTHKAGLYYTFTNDKNGSSTCYGACADAWPSVAANGATMPGPGLDAALFSNAAAGTTAPRIQGRQVAGVPLCR